MRFLESKIPPPLVLIVLAFLMRQASKLEDMVSISTDLRIAIASTIFSFALAFGVSAIVPFIRLKTTINPSKPETTTALVSSGIYRISRNPMYVGLSLVLLAWAVYLSSVLSLLGVIIFCAYLHYFQIKPEERALKALFGKEFDTYRSQVRRWL